MIVDPLNCLRHVPSAVVSFSQPEAAMPKAIVLHDVHNPDERIAGRWVCDCPYCSPLSFHIGANRVVKPVVSSVGGVGPRDMNAEMLNDAPPSEFPLNGLDVALGQRPQGQALRVKHGGFNRKGGGHLPYRFEKARRSARHVTGGV